MTAICYVLAFLIGSAFAQATMIEDYLKAMQERRFSNGDDTRDFAQIHISASIDTVIERCTRFIKRGSADREVLAYVHVRRARWVRSFEDRIRDYENALELTTQGAAYVHVEMAQAYATQDWASAMQHFDKAIALNSRDPYTLFKRARVHQQANKNELALRDFDTVIALVPRKASAYIQRATIQRGLGDIERSLQDYHKAFELAEPQFIKNTQWNLKEKGYYTGETDGVYREAFQNAVASCIKDEKCKSPVFAWTFETSPDRP